MPKRLSKVNSVVRRDLKELPDVVLIGHPCGFIAPVGWLRSRPKLSIAAGDFLLNDASMQGDFEEMLCKMIIGGATVSRRVKRHLKHWYSKGCPHWTGEQRTYLLNAWMKERFLVLLEDLPAGVRSCHSDSAEQGLRWIYNQPPLVLEVEGELCENMTFFEMMDFADHLSTTGASFRLVPYQEDHEYSNSNSMDK